MKDYKRLLALLLCLVLCMSLLPAVAFAEQEQNESVLAEEIVVEEEAAVLPEEVTKEPEPAEENATPDIVEETLIFEGENFSEEPMAAVEHLPVIVYGTWGKKKNLEWKLNTKTGELIIAGDGKMDNFSENSIEAWREYRRIIKSVEIGSGVTSIGDYAFLGCNNLEYVKIPEGVSRLGKFAFSACNSLMYATIPEGVTNIEEYTFFGCTSLTSVNIPNGVLSIEGYAFAGCNNLTWMTIPEGVTKIGANAFYNCSSLTRVTIPESVTTIGLAGTFASCSSLTEIYFLGAPPTIGDTAFEDVTATAYYLADKGWTEEYMQNYAGELTWICSTTYSGTWGNLTWTLSAETGTLTISGYGKMDDFGWYTKEAWHAYNSEIKSVEIRSGVTSIGDAAFQDCGYMKGITIPESVTSIGYDAFFNCWNLESVAIPQSVTSIGSMAFYSCGGLENVTIPDGVTSIFSGTFFDCLNLKSVTIPENVTYIEGGATTWGAFENCIDLTEIYFLGAPPTIGNTTAFKRVTATAYYPSDKGWTASDMQNYGGNLTWVQYTIKNGLVLDDDGVWRYYENGLFDSTKAGIVEYNGSRFFVANGVVASDPQYDGLQLNAEDGKWYFLAAGMVAEGYDWAAYNGFWFRLNGHGELDVNANGLYDYNGGIFLVAAGQIKTDYTGIYSENGVDYNIVNGQVWNV